jgi:hypothetical protein
MPSRRNHIPSASCKVCIEFNGKKFCGSYQVEGRPPLVYLTFGYGNKATQLGITPPDIIARQLLHEVVGIFR